MDLKSFVAKFDSNVSKTIIQRIVNRIEKESSFYNSEDSFVVKFHQYLCDAIKEDVKLEKDEEIESFFEFALDDKARIDLVLLLRNDKIDLPLILLFELKYFAKEKWLQYGSSTIGKTNIPIRYTDSYEKKPNETKMSLINKDVEKLKKYKRDNKTNAKVFCYQITLTNETEVRDAFRTSYPTTSIEEFDLKAVFYYSPEEIVEPKNKVIKWYNIRFNKKLTLEKAVRFEELIDYVDKEKEFELEVSTNHDNISITREEVLNYSKIKDEFENRNSYYSYPIPHFFLTVEVD